ncbi:unnamed protein product [Tetraodon nigroviridis]|uniref:(spotted green pufferfish) hypothetical protein n=1 Tax=Tetraodon nigroviridis TaxID=99883 RepID=Q4RE59_TETNG|nr:unnamed protein product [Tetraodon nigroviridis]
MSFALKINNRRHLIHLKKNRDFLHPNFAQYSHNRTGNHKSPAQKSPVSRYFGDLVV